MKSESDLSKCTCKWNIYYINYCSLPLYITYHFVTYMNTAYELAKIEKH